MTLSCFHCGLPCSDNKITGQISDQQQTFCCIGCRAAADAIANAGLTDFYQYRDQYSENANSYGKKLKTQFKIYDDPDVQAAFTSQVDNQISFSLQIEGITCAACVWLIEKSLVDFDEVDQATLNLSTHRLSITMSEGANKISPIFHRIHSLGYGAKPWKGRNHDHLVKLQKDFLIRIGIAGIGMMQVMMNTFALYLGDIDIEFESLLRWASLILTLPVFFYSAVPFYRAAWRDFKSRHFGMDVPVSLALILAFLPSVWATITGLGDTYFESVTMFTFFLLIGRYFEFKSRLNLDQFSDGLDDLIPAVAHLIIDGKSIDLASFKLNVGDIIEVRPGEQVPADGVIISGSSQINEASVTGEFSPVQTSLGQLVKAGTINTDGLLQIKITQVGQQTTVSQMLRLLEKASAQKPKVAELADKGASWFVLLVLFLSLATGISWYFINPSDAFWIAISVLVITCPCALSLATPVSLTSSISALRKSGALPTNSKALTLLPKTTHVVFDKTGTLTQGEFVITEWTNESGLSDQTILGIAAALESHSEHPLAKPFQQWPESSLIDNICIFPNKGISGKIKSEEYRIGSIDFCLNTPIQTPNDQQWIALSSVEDQILLAWFKLEDQVRPDARQTIQYFKNKGLQTWLLTGDSSEAALRIGKNLGIDHSLNGLSSQNKVDQIKALQNSGASVLMIGDGINDAPALSISDTSIAMGNGTELSKNTADIILLKDQLLPVIACFNISNKTNRIINQNLSWGLLYNVIALPFAMIGLVTPWMAAIGMSFSSLLVVFNALRLTKIPKTQNL